jgi:SAM-dependent methyltransferase
MNEEHFEKNRRHWDEVTPIHARSKFYDLDSFKRGQTSLLPVEIAELGEVTGKRMLHLQCHFGMDTLSWTRMGAVVTGVDFSPVAIGMARQLSEELDLPARFIESNIYDLDNTLQERFDIVFTSYGVLLWLPDLTGWARMVASHLEPGGTFYIVEEHPCAACLDDKVTERLQMEFPYFTGGTPLQSDEPGTYTDSDSDIQNTKTVEWPHPLSEIIDSLIVAGLELEYLHEFPFGFYERHPNMKRGEDGLWRFLDMKWSFPLMFSIKARKQCP